MNLVLVNRFEVSIVRRPQNGVGYVFTDNLGDTLCDPFLGTNLCEAEDDLPVGFVLCVAVGCDFWFNSAGIVADEIGGRS